MIFLTLLDTEEERDKFEALFEKYKGMMFSSINKIVNDKHLSEDILQEAFIKIANNIDKVNDDINSNDAKGFIMTVTTNTALDFYRKNSKRRDVELFVDEFDEAVFYDFDEKLISKLDPENRIIAVIKSMKEMYRDILLLKFVHGLENKEIAKLFNLTEEAVRQRISRGKKMLEDKLEGMGK